MYNYKLLAKKLESLTDYFGSGFSEQDLLDVKEYIHHGEYGLAYELLCYLIIKQNIKVASEIYGDIINLGQLMKIEEKVWSQIICSKSD